MRQIAIMLIFSLTVLHAKAQERLIKGLVRDQTNRPVGGATIRVKETALSTETDDSGRFSITVHGPSSILIISHVGMETQELSVGNRDDISVLLQNSTGGLNEVVVVGYSVERKKDLKGAVAVVDLKETLKETNSNLLTSLQGRVAGVNITTNGAPGSNATINIRGISSILGDIQPLYVVDGIPTKDINNLSPSDIESLQIMKDAASAAIYGARGANGVVVITTRSGKSEKTKVTLDAFYGRKWLRGGLDMLNALEYGQVLWQQKKNDNQPLTDAIYGTGPEPTIPEFIDDGNTIPAGDVDYLKEVYQPASNMAVNFGIAKAVNKSSFYFGVNYNREEGLAVHTHYDRLTLRVNSSFQLTKGITIGENLSVGRSTEVREQQNRTIENAIFQHPIIPVRDALGNFGGPVKNLGDRLNAIGELFFNKDNQTEAWRTFGNAYINIEFVKGLTYRSSFAVDAINSTYQGFFPKYTMGRFRQTANSLTRNNRQILNLTATNTLTYMWQRDGHDLQALAGYEWINNRNDFFFAARRDFALEAEDYRYLSGGTALTDANGESGEYGLIGAFGKINYGYSDKYLFSASLRRDGSSRFGAQNRYGVFPALSGAWRISQENFFQNLGYQVSELKLRGSWGKNGNDGIPDYAYVTNYGSNVDYSNYDLGGTNGLAQVGYYSTRIGNPAVKWEASVQTNIGLDLGLANNRFLLTADYYVKRTDDLLYPALTPGVRGEGSAPFINIGDIKNSGIEIMASYRGPDRSRIKYNFDLSFTSIRNRVMSVGLDGNDIRTTARGRIVAGQPLFAFYGHQADGIFKTQKEVDDHPGQIGKGLGRIRFRDIDGNGVVDQNDRTYLGSPFPKFSLGLNAAFTFANFDATFFFDANVGNKIYDEFRPVAYSLFYNSNHSKELLNAWSPENPGSDIPMLTSNNTNDENRTSSFYLRDGSYVRLKSAVVGYNFKGNALTRLKVSGIRLYLQAQNVFEFTRFDGFDYEPFGFEGILSQSLYPHARSVTVGVNVGF